ncbi:MAG: BamA/TamA family outer membrane protein [bacterium]
MNHTHLKYPLFAALVFAQSAVSADYITLDESEQFGDTRWGALPYLFSTDSLGNAFGAGAYVGGIHQPQSSLAFTAFKTSNESSLISGWINNFQFENYERWFFDVFLLGSHYTDQRFYDTRFRLGAAPAGSNDSDKDDFVTGISDDLHFELTSTYVLPIGAGKENPLTVFKTSKGMLSSPARGGQQWDPDTSGKTTLSARYFYRYRDLQEFEDSDELAARTNGLEFWIDYENTDFAANPSYGSRQTLTLTRDFGWFDSSNSWTNLEFEASKYFDLGTSNWFRQQVIALNIWTSHTPSWDLDKSTGKVDHRPPPGFGSTLGGYDRMRAYPEGRFHDKSAVYYGAELRLTPQYNGLDEIPLIKLFEIDWWQVVAFAEAGRVAPEYSSDLFFKDLKWDVGLSFRIMSFRQPLRLDWAVSEEDYSIWAMYAQPFSR